MLFSPPLCSLKGPFAAAVAATMLGTSACRSPEAAPTAAPPASVARASAAATSPPAPPEPAPSVTASTAPALPTRAPPAPLSTLPLDIGPPLVPAKCRRPLAQYCRFQPCPRYDTAVREAVQEGSGPSLGTCLAREGVCGALRFVSRGDGFSNETGYFDANGHLVAGLRTSDTNSFCDGTSYMAFYGTPPVCNQIVLADYCKAE